jgi:hypothetical protein
MRGKDAPGLICKCGEAARWCEANQLFLCVCGRWYTNRFYKWEGREREEPLGPPYPRVRWT